MPDLRTPASPSVRGLPSGPSLGVENGIEDSLQPPACRPPRGRAAFTLVELLITVAIIAIMAGMILFAMYRAQETAKQQKTRALVAKLDAIINSKWESYKTRRVPVAVPPSATPMEAARLRLDGLRDLMRMELPDRYTDIVRVDEINNWEHEVMAMPSEVEPDLLWPYSQNPIAPPAVYYSYLRRIEAAVSSTPAPSVEHQSAEMLYLIVTAALSGEEDSRDVLKADNIGDTDGDGMMEFIDGWGNPIKFARWPAGFLSERVILARGHSPEITPQASSLAVTKYTLEFNLLSDPRNATLSATPGAYVGGTLAQVEPGAHLLLAKTETLARITGYDVIVNASTGNRLFRFTCAIPPSADTLQHPFKWQPPNPLQPFVVLPPDPFDPMGVYPIYPPGYAKWSDIDSNSPDWSARTWALYPLVYSAGSDGQDGIVNEDIRNNATPPWRLLHYVDQGLNPFYVQTMNHPTFDVVGMPVLDKAIKPKAFWVDNIHNHQLAAR